MQKMVRTIQASCILGFMILSGCAGLTTPPPVAPSRSVTNQDQTTIQKDKDQATIRALQKQLQERDQAILLRDQQIDMLSSQLDALKRIDQDTQEGRRVVRPPMITAP